MSALAELTVDLLTFFTFSPPGGHPPEDVAPMEIAWWQTLIHDLSPAETEQIKAAMQAHIEDLSAMGSLPKHLQMKLEALESFVRGEMQ